MVNVLLFKASPNVNLVQKIAVDLILNILTFSWLSSHHYFPNSLRSFQSRDKRGAHLYSILEVASTMWRFCRIFGGNLKKQYNYFLAHLILQVRSFSGGWQICQRNRSQAKLEIIAKTLENILLKQSQVASIS